MRHTIAMGLGAAIVVALTAAACGGGSSSSTPSTPTSPTNPTTPTTPTNGATITIGADGRVSPASVTITRGSRVTMINSHNRPHDMSSDPHPEHTQCPDLTWGFLQPGQQVTSGNMNTARTCGYHDHGEPDAAGLKGSVIIQ